MRYLIQDKHGATLYAFTSKKARDAKVILLRGMYPRTTYTTKDIK